MSTQIATYDVFLSYSLTEARVADLVERTLSEAGLDVFNSAKAEVDGTNRNVLWRALAESSALVAIIPPLRTLPSTVSVEIGAAMAWHKAIYVIHTERGHAKLPKYLASFPAYPVSRIDDVALAITRGLVLLGEEDRSVLGTLYSKLGIPTDRLLQEPAAIEEFAEEFNRQRGTHMSGERLLQELIRLRKSGDLPRLRAKSK